MQDTHKKAQREEKELEIRELSLSLSSDRKSCIYRKKKAVFNPATVPLVPTFNESEVDGSFKTFESLARRNKWLENQWVSLFVPKLVGKAYMVYNNLDRDNYADKKFNCRCLLYNC